jgi:hypothetical protein
MTSPQKEVGADQGRARWRTGSDMPTVEDRHRRAAAWALDRAPDSQSWENLTAHYRTPDQLWQAKRVAEAFARFERDLIATASRTQDTEGAGA